MVSHAYSVGCYYHPSTYTGFPTTSKNERGIAVPRFQFLTLKGPKGTERPLDRIMAISMIERRSAWYDIYDERGKKQKTLSESVGEVLGWSAKFFVVRRSAWYDLYDELGKKYKTLSESIGSFVSISGDTFIVRRSAWLDTYDRTGKKINTRSAH